MRTLIIVFILLTAVGQAQENLAMLTKEAPIHIDSSFSDEDQIKAVIIKETDSYSNDDMDAWRSCFTQSAQTAYLYRWPDGTTGQVVGFKNLEAMVQGWMDGEEDSDYTTLDRYHWNIKINGDVAWVTYKEKAKIDGKEYTIEEIRILEKIGGQWKLDMIGYIF